MSWIDKEITRKYNKVADLFPLLDGSDFDELKADIAKNGLLGIHLAARGREYHRRQEQTPGVY